MGKRVPIALALLAVILTIAPVTGSAGTILPPVYKVTGTAFYDYEGADNDFDVIASVKSISYSSTDIVLGSEAVLQFHTDMVGLDGLKASFIDSDLWDGITDSPGEFRIASADTTYLTGQIEKLIVKPACRDGALKAKAFVDITGGEDAGLFTGASGKLLAFVFDLEGESAEDISLGDDLWFKSWTADFKGSFGRTSRSYPEPEPSRVPEPATTLLLIPGLAGLAFRRMRRG